MQVAPQELTLDISPKARFDIININDMVSQHMNGHRDSYSMAAYCSFHTTAGYLEQSLCNRLRHNQDRIASYISAFQQLFPTNAEYRHDQMELRTELSEDQRQCEPKNGDSHLTFIGSGLKNCVTYQNEPGTPVYFIDLDGVHEHGARQRQTSVLFYNQEETVFEQSVEVPVSNHPIDSINLRNPRLGYLDKLNDLLEKYEVEKGRVEVALDPSERNAGLTVNEYETLLMTHDLVEVLKNPVKYMGEKGRYIIQNPQKIPSRTKDYAKYDFVQVFNELMDAFHISESVIEKMLAQFIALPAERFLQVKKNINLLISNQETGKPARIVQGTYQSPILVQWKRSQKKSRRLKLTITRFK